MGLSNFLSSPLIIKLQNMKLLNLFIFIFILGLLACGDTQPKTTNDAVTPTNSASSKKSSKVTLEKLWTSEDGFVTPEAVVFDADRNVFYVANINENPWEEDQNGFISKMDANGKILELKWVTSLLSGPKGMAVDGDRLLVADINQLAIIDVHSGNINGRYALPPGTNLNDITLGEVGTAYISASGSKSIHSLVGQDLKPMILNMEFSPNGVFYENGTLNVLGFDTKKMYTINLKDNNSMKEMASNIGAADGIEADGHGGYITSDWNGAIYHINSNGETAKLLDTKGDKKGAADIEYVSSTQMLLVPTFFDNHVEAYKVKFN